MSEEEKTTPEIQDSEILLGHNGQVIGITIPDNLPNDGSYHLEVSKGNINIIKDGEKVSSVKLRDDIPKEVYDGLAEQENTALISDNGKVMVTATMNVDQESTDTAPAIDLSIDKKTNDEENNVDYSAFKKMMEDNDEAEKLRQQTMEDFRQGNSFVPPEAANSNVINDIKSKGPEEFIAQAAVPLKPGDSVVGKVDSVASIGASKNETRAQGVAKAVGGFVVPIATTMAVKMVIGSAMTAALGPAIAAIAVPAVFAGYAAYKLMGKSKEQEGGVFKKLASAAKENKFHAGMLLGALAIGIAARTGGLEPIADFLDDKISSFMGNAPEVSAIDQVNDSTAMNASDVTITELSNSDSTPVEETPQQSTPAHDDKEHASDPWKHQGEDNNGLDPWSDNKPEVTATVTPIETEPATGIPAEYADLSASGMKEKAFELFNGRGGEEVDQAMAVKLYEEAAAMGSESAKVDLAYIQYHGLAGVDQDQAGAVADMKEMGKTQWLGGQDVPELNSGTAHTHEDSAPSSTSDAPITYQGWEEYPAFPEGSDIDEQFGQRLAEAIQSGTATAEGGIATIDPVSNQILFTHDMGNGQVVTHVIEMDEYKSAEFLKGAELGIMDGALGFDASEMQDGMKNMLDFATIQGGDPQIGVVIGFVNEQAGMDTSGGSIDVHAFKDDSGNVQYKIITDDYFAENGDDVKQAAALTIELEEMGNQIVFSNDFEKNTENMVNNNATIIPTPDAEQFVDESLSATPETTDNDGPVEEKKGFFERLFGSKDADTNSASNEPTKPADPESKFAADKPDANTAKPTSHFAVDQGERVNVSPAAEKAMKEAVERTLNEMRADSMKP